MAASTSDVPPNHIGVGEKRSAGIRYMERSPAGDCVRKCGIATASGRILPDTIMDSDVAKPFRMLSAYRTTCKVWEFSFRVYGLGVKAWFGGLMAWRSLGFGGFCHGCIWASRAYQSDEQTAAAHLAHDAPHQRSVSLREFGAQATVVGPSHYAGGDTC